MQYQGKHKIRTNDASHGFGVGLVLALADGQAGSRIWLAYLVCPMQAAWEGVPARRPVCTSSRRLAPNARIFTHIST